MPRPTPRLAPIVVAVALLVAARGAHAQAPSPVDSGARVRVRHAAGGTTVGRLVAAGPDSLRVRTASREVALPLLGVQGLERSQGRSAGYGALTGAGVGAAVVGGAGLVLTGAVYLTERGARARGGYCGDFGCYFGTAVMGALTVAGAVAGAATGALVGAVIGRERWQQVPLARRDARYRPRVAPGADGVQLGLTVRF